jgi:hypothetical protein
VLRHQLKVFGEKSPTQWQNLPYKMVTVGPDWLCSIQHIVYN